MLRVGLTGGIGSGKSLVARIFSTLGVPVFEADREARRLMHEDAELRAAIAVRFGADIYGTQGLDRKRLAVIVFNDTAALAELNALVHPAVRNAFAQWAAQQRAPYVVMEAAILAESGGHAGMDRIVVVGAQEDLRVRRVMARDGVGEDEVRARMRNQADDARREAIAHHVLHNDERQLLLPQVVALHHRLTNEALGAPEA
jgi:dephospho-CoA kinase